MNHFPKTVLVDTCFLYAVCDPRDQYYAQAKAKRNIIETSNVLLPWPCLYETLNTYFVKNSHAIKRFEVWLKKSHVIQMSDEPYREAALEQVMKTAASRSMALVDMVLRLILEDPKVRKHAILTFNPRDFSDVCRKHRIEMP